MTQQERVPFEELWPVVQGMWPNWDEVPLLTPTEYDWYAVEEEKILNASGWTTQEFYAEAMKRELYLDPNALRQAAMDWDQGAGS